MIFRIAVFILTSSLYLFAVNLSSVTSTQEADTIKFVLNFDGSFNGSTEQNRTEKGLLLTFSGLNVEQRKDFSFDGSFVQKAVLAKIGQDQAVLYLETANQLNTEVVKTADGQKLTLVVTQKPMLNAQQQVEPIKDSSLDMLGWRYVVVIIFMVILILILFVVKKKVQNGANRTISSMLSKGEDDINIVSQRFIDNANRLMLIEYDNAKYLILVGASSMVIDKFYDNVSDITDADFQKALAFTQVTNNNAKPREDQRLTDFDEYKMRAEGEF